jgi:hypothetical protein
LAQNAENCCILDVEVYQNDYIYLHQNESKSADQSALPVCFLDDITFTGKDPLRGSYTIGSMDPPWLYQPPIHLRHASLLI